MSRYNLFSTYKSITSLNINDISGSLHELIVELQCGHE